MGNPRQIRAPYLLAEAVGGAASGSGRRERELLEGEGGLVCLLGSRHLAPPLQRGRRRPRLGRCRDGVELGVELVVIPALVAAASSEGETLCISASSAPGGEGGCRHRLDLGGGCRHRPDLGGGCCHRPDRGGRHAVLREGEATRAGWEERTGCERVRGVGGEGRVGEREGRRRLGGCQREDGLVIRVSDLFICRR